MPLNESQLKAAKKILKMVQEDLLDELEEFLDENAEYEKLLKAIRDTKGNSLLHLAALNGSLGMVKYLVEEGEVNIYARNKCDQTASQITKSSKVRSYLRKKEMAPFKNLKPNSNKSWEDWLENLIEKGAGLDLHDDDGNSMAHHAALSNCSDLLDAMEEEFGAKKVYSCKNYQKKRPADLVSKCKGKYISFNGQYILKPGVRPTNQNQAGVQKKIAKRLKRDLEENPSLEHAKIHKDFIKSVEKNGSAKLKDKAIDIAHNIAISVIVEAIVYRMNHPVSGKEDEMAAQLVEDMVTTEDENSKEKCKQFFNGLQNSYLPPHKKIREAAWVIKRLNKASKNLAPGHAASNRGIGKKRDLHMLLKKGSKKEGSAEEWVEIWRSKIICLAFQDFLKHSEDTYKPKTRKKEGKIEALSSSVAADTNKAYVPYSAPVRFLGKKSHKVASCSCKEELSESLVEEYDSPAI